MNVYQYDIRNGCERTLMWEMNFVPHTPVDHPVSPPCSPRELGEGDDYPEYDINYSLLYVFEWPRYISQQEISFWNKQSIPKNIKKQSSTKRMRRMGKLKQPGGASCNQRR